LGLSIDDLSHLVEVVEFLQSISTRTIEVVHKGPAMCHTSGQL